MSEDTREKYWSTVNSIAQDAIDEYEITSQEKFDLDHDSLYQYVTESVDGSYWVIHCEASRRCLEFTNNENELTDQGMELNTSNGVPDIFTQLAYFAMQADVWDKLGDIYDDLPPYEDDEEEEDEEG